MVKNLNFLSKDVELNTSNSHVVINEINMTSICHHLDTNLIFPSVENWYTSCSELNWSQIRLIMRLDSKEERDYYIEQSKNILRLSYGLNI